MRVFVFADDPEDRHILTYVLTHFIETIQGIGYRLTLPESIQIARD